MEDPATRRTFNVKSDREVKETLTSLLGELGPPVQVVFNTSRCLDCSVVGDSRLLTKYCHMEPVMTHPGTVESHHPGRIEHYHPSHHHILEHDGRLKKVSPAGQFTNLSLLCPAVLVLQLPVRDPPQGPVQLLPEETGEGGLQQEVGLLPDGSRAGRSRLFPETQVLRGGPRHLSPHLDLCGCCCYCC